MTTVIGLVSVSEPDAVVRIPFAAVSAVPSNPVPYVHPVTAVEYSDKRTAFSNQSS